jgi:single-stranded DNA-binding protein
MSQVKAVFTGGIVAEPERRQVGGANLLEFPVYVNHSKKNKETGEYEPTGDVSKVKVTLWRELADNTDVQKGDLVEVTGTIVEKEFDKKDGTKGRQIQTDWVESVVVKYRKDTELVGAAAGFDSTEGGF